MILNLSAKSRFLFSAQKASQHTDTVRTPAFQEACDMALLEYQDQLHMHSKEATDRAANFERLMGAREFLFVLLNLGEREVPAAKREDKLNLKVI